MIALVGLTLLAGVGGALRGALVPDGYDGTILYLSRSVNGDQFVNVGIGHRNVSVYRDVVERLGGRDVIVGERMEKDPWARTVRIDDRSISLDPPGEFYRFIVVLAMLLVVALARWWRATPAG